MDPVLVYFCCALSIIFGTFFGACAAAIAKECTSHCGHKGMETRLVITGLGIGLFCLLVVVLCVGRFLPGVTFSVFFIGIYVIGTIGSPTRTGLSVALKMKVSEKLIADEGELLSLLDHDQDGVVSRDDIDKAIPRVAGSALTTNEIDCLQANMSEFGHCIDKEHSFYVLTRSDLGNLAGRMSERHKAWLVP